MVHIGHGRTRPYLIAANQTSPRLWEPLVSDRETRAYPRLAVVLGLDGFVSWCQSLVSALRGRESLGATPVEAATVEVATAADDAGPKISAGLGCRLEGRGV